MQLVTYFGDIAVLLPASLGLTAFLAWIGSRQEAAAYAAAVLLCLTAALLAKLAFATCGEQSSLFGVESPSGHVAFSATFYGCLAMLLAAKRAISRQLALYAGAAVVILAIGASRVALDAHTVPEVVIGGAIGAGSLACFNALRVQTEPLILSSRAIAQVSPFVALYALSVLLFAGHWTAEPLIDAIAARLGANLHLCR